MKKIIRLLFLVIFAFLGLSGCANEEEEAIRKAAQNINDARKFYYYFLDIKYTEENSVITIDNWEYYKMIEEYNTREKLYNAAHQYYCSDIIDKKIMSHIHTMDEDMDKPPFMIEYEGILYQSGQYGLGPYRTYHPENIEKIEINGNHAIVDIPWIAHFPDEIDEGIFSFEYIKEDGEWLLTDAFSI